MADSLRPDQPRRRWWQWLLAPLRRMLPGRGRAVVPLSPRPVGGLPVRASWIQLVEHLRVRRASLWSWQSRQSLQRLARRPTLLRRSTSGDQPSGVGVPPGLGAPPTLAAVPRLGEPRVGGSGAAAGSPGRFPESGRREASSALGEAALRASGLPESGFGAATPGWPARTAGLLAHRAERLMAQRGARRARAALLPGRAAGGPAAPIATAAAAVPPGFAPPQARSVGAGLGVAAERAVSGLAPALILPVGRAVVLRGADTTAVPLAQPGHSITGAAAPATTTASNPYRPAAGPADLSSTRAVRRSEGTAHSLISTGTRTAQQGPVLPAPLPLSTSAASEQWRAAVARQPLEQPQPFTGGLARLARTVAGRSVRWTTGPATRAALAVSGATAATTGTVVHLPAPPHRTDPTVLVHELSHLRSTVGRPRFLRPAATVSADSEERRAVAATQAMVSPAPMLARVPTTAMRTASSTASSTVPSSAPSIASLPAAAASVSPPAALSTATLPVAGLAGIPRAVHDQVQRLATTAVGGSSGGGTGGATGALQRAVDVGGIAAQPGVSGVGPGATAAPTGGPDATGAPGDSGGSIDLDAMVELLEARLVREFERRGGRFAEVF